MFLVDTNVLVHAANDQADEHAVCRGLLERWRSQDTPWFTTWGVLYEWLRVMTHPGIFRTPLPIGRGIGFVDSLLRSPGIVVLSPTQRHAAVLAKTVAEVPRLAGNILHDVHTAVLMREHGVRRIVTLDSDFHRFPFLEVVDPSRSDDSDVVRERPARGPRHKARSRPQASRAIRRSAPAS
jgi:hypothetical protein